MTFLHAARCECCDYNSCGDQTSTSCENIWCFTKGPEAAASRTSFFLFAVVVGSKCQEQPFVLQWASVHNSKIQLFLTWFSVQHRNDHRVCYSFWLLLATKKSLSCKGTPFVISKTMSFVMVFHSFSVKTLTGAWPALLILRGDGAPSVRKMVC